MHKPHCVLSSSTSLNLAPKEQHMVIVFMLPTHKLGSIPFDCLVHADFVTKYKIKHTHVHLKPLEPLKLTLVVQADPSPPSVYANFVTKYKIKRTFKAGWTTKINLYAMKGIDGCFYLLY